MRHNLLVVLLESWFAERLKRSDVVVVLVPVDHMPPHLKELSLHQFVVEQVQLIVTSSVGRPDRDDGPEFVVSSLLQLLIEVNEAFLIDERRSANLALVVLRIEPA